MISVVICSVDKELQGALTANISDTIGVPWELLVIDNNIEKLSIAAAYNRGASKAKYDTLCFVHEDVFFHSNNWGVELSKTLNEKKIGLIGACGAVVKPNVPAGWSAVPEKYYRSNLVQRLKNGNKRIGIRKDNDNKHFSEVVVADGFFLITRREIWEEFPFDERNFKGFHFYDQDFSLRISRKYKVVVDHNVLIEHFSTGSKNNEWIIYSRVFHKKWIKILPVSLVGLSSAEDKQVEVHALRSYIRVHLVNKIYSAYVLKHLIHLLILQPFSRVSYAFFYQWIVRKSFN